MEKSSKNRPIKLPGPWLELLAAEFDRDYMQSLSRFLRERRQGGARIYPPPAQIFSAFWHTKPEQVRVVILGQDPYHNPGQAHGLCFSVNPGVPVPPSLANIYRELQADLGFDIPPHGYLKPWADRGVLLLNSVLTVEHNQPGSHQGKGWERFTDSVIEALNARQVPIIFMLWGAQAQKKGRSIDRGRHLVLTAPHPSPLSAHRGFLGCRHFSAANRFLEERGMGALDWSLPRTPALS